MTDNSQQPASSPVVVITMAQMYEEQRAMHDELRSLAAKIDPALAEFKVDLAEQKSEGKEIHTDFETRIRALEKGWWKYLGASGIIAIAVGWVADYVIRTHG